MGDENSLAGITKAHKHSTLSTDGGFLESTVTGLTGGSAGQLLEQTATGVPNWATLSSTAVWNNEGGDSGDKASLTVTGMTGRDITKVFYHLEPSTISTYAYPMLRINGEVVDYDLVNDCVYESGQATTVNRSTSGYFLDEESGHTSELVYFGEMTIFKGNPTLAWTGNMLKNQTGSMRNDMSPGIIANTIQGAGAQPDTSAITEVSLVMTSGNISGKIQVITMDLA
jgi:hypothetical protein